MKLKTLKKGSSAQVYRTGNAIASSLALLNGINSLSYDIANIYDEYNNKLVSAFSGLAKGTEDSISGLDDTKDAIRNGIDGRSVFVDRSSDENSVEWEYSTSLSRQLTIKEGLLRIYNSLSAKIDTVENAIPTSSSGLTDYTIAYIGAKAFDEDDTSSDESIDGRLSLLETDLTSLQDTVDSLESGTSLPNFSQYAVLFGDGTNVPVTDFNYFKYNSTLKSLSLGTTNAIVGTSAFAHGTSAVALYNNCRAVSAGQFVKAGDAQALECPMKVSTNGNTPTSLVIDSIGSKLTTENDSTYAMIAHISGRSTTTASACFYTIRCLFYRGIGTGTLNVSSLTKETIREDDPAFDATIVADAGAGVMDIKVTGITGLVVNWAALVNIIKITG